MIESYATVALESPDAPAPGSSGGARVRVIPYGVTIEHEGRRITYDPGSISIPDFVPVNIDHGDGVLHRIGRLERGVSSPDGLYGELKISDTTIGRDVRTLLVDGVLTDVSAGVAIDRARDRTAGGILHRHGSLDHISIVTRGAFSGSPSGARVLAAYQDTEIPIVPDAPAPEIQPTTEAPAAQYAELARVETLEATVARLQVPAPALTPTRPGNFRDLNEYFLTQRDAVSQIPSAVERMALYRREAETALAATRAGVSEYVLDDDTTTTAAGLVPDYLSSEIIGLITTQRPFVESIPSDPIGPHGMSIVYPKVVTRPDVGVQATEKTEVTSQAMDIDPFTVDLVTYAGATDVSLQLVERSQPSFLNRLFAELAGVYSERTDAAAIAAVVAAVDALGTHEAVLANLGADAAATYQAFAVASGVIAGSVKRPADTIWLSTDKWAELMSLVDADGRPLIVPENGANEQGAGSFATFRFRYGGWRVIVDPFAAANTVLIGWSGGAATVELRPQQLRALQVDLLGVNAGVWGLFATVVKYPQAFYILKEA